MPDMLTRIRRITHGMADKLHRKNEQYGESWCKRGGQQAFAVIWRKADRIESILAKMDNGYDIFAAWEENPGDIQDDIRDLRDYLLLLEEYMTRPKIEGSSIEGSSKIMDHRILSIDSGNNGPVYIGGTLDSHKYWTQKAADQLPFSAQTSEGAVLEEAWRLYNTRSIRE